MPKRKGNLTRTISFRVTTELGDALRKQASKSGLSLNAYVVRSLHRDLEWSSIFGQYDFLHLSRQALMAFLQQIDDEALRSIGGKVGVSLLKDVLYGLYGATNLEALRKGMELFAKFEYSWPVSYSHFENDAGEHFVLRHGVCLQWSKYQGEVIKRYLEELGLEAKYEVTNNSLIVTISRPKTP